MAARPEARTSSPKWPISSGQIGDAAPSWVMAGLPCSTIMEEPSSSLKAQVKKRSKRSEANVRLRPEEGTVPKFLKGAAKPDERRQTPMRTAGLSVWSEG